MRGFNIVRAAGFEYFVHVLYLSVCLSTYLSTYLFCLYIQATYQSYYLSLYISLYLYIICLSVLSIYPVNLSNSRFSFLSICPSFLFYPSIFPSMHLSVYMSISLSFLSVSLFVYQNEALPRHVLQKVEVKAANPKQFCKTSSKNGSWNCGNAENLPGFLQKCKLKTLKHSNSGRRPTGMLARHLMPPQHCGCDFSIPSVSSAARKSAAGHTKRCACHAQSS